MKVNYTKEGRGGVLAEEVFLAFITTHLTIIATIVATIKIIIMQGEIGTI